VTNLNEIPAFKNYFLLHATVNVVQKVKHKTNVSMMEMLIPMAVTAIKELWARAKSWLQNNVINNVVGSILIIIKNNF